MNASFLRQPPHLRCRTNAATESAWRSKFLRKTPRQGSRVVQLTLPDDEYPPARSFQFTFRSSVARNVAVELALPELRTGLGDVGQPAVVAVPEAAVHKKGNPPAPKDDIRLPRKVPGMEPKSVVHSVQKPANGNFGPRVAASDTAHESASLGPAHDVEPRTQLASARNRW